MSFRLPDIDTDHAGQRRLRPEWWGAPCNPPAVAVAGSLWTLGAQCSRPGRAQRFESVWAGVCTGGRAVCARHLLASTPSSRADILGQEPIRMIICNESGKIFSVGYDRSLCIWDTDHLAHTRAGFGKGATKGKAKKLQATTAAAEP